MSGAWEEEEGHTLGEEVRPSPPWSEERCEELWDRVEEVRHKLTRILNPAKLTPYLRQCKVIDEQDEDEVLNSTQYPLRISKAGRLLDILHSQGQRGLQAFMESLEFYHPEQYTQLTGEEPTQCCSLILDEEGPEGLTQFLLLEVQKLREQLRHSRMYERRVSQRCRVAEEERGRAERKVQELRQDRLQFERVRQDWEMASRELGRLKDRHLEQAMKLSRVLEEQGEASTRERELLREVEELKSRLTEAEIQAVYAPDSTVLPKTTTVLSSGVRRCPPPLPQKPLHHEIRKGKVEDTESQIKTKALASDFTALMDILQQDRREAAEQRQDLCDIITKLQGEQQSIEEHRDKVTCFCAWEEEEGHTLGEEVRPSPPWSEERCEELWDRVEEVRHKLTRILNPAKLTPYLRQCKVIDEQDEDEVLNSTQYPLRISKAGRLLDILHSQGQRGLQAFMESLEFYHPEQYTQLTGEEPTQCCSLILDEEGPEGLTQFLLLEVQKLREQLRHSRMYERRVSQRCRVAEEERGRAERKVQELRQDRLQFERVRQDWEMASRELGRLKDRHLEQAMKLSRVLEEQGEASTRGTKSRLTEAEIQAVYAPDSTVLPKTTTVLSSGVRRCPPPLPQKPLHHEIRKGKVEDTESQIKTKALASDFTALMDILQQDRREAAEQRQDLCDIITKLQGEQQSIEEHRDKLESQCEQLQLKVRILQLDWETEQKRSLSYFNQIMELEKERDQALRSRDSLQLEYTDCLLDKNRLRKHIAELQANLEQLQTELEREREKSQEQTEQLSACLHCSHLSLCSEDQCYGPCCSVGLDLSPHLLLRKMPSRGQTNENCEGSYSNSEENLLTSLETNEKEINRLSTFPFPPCMNSINRRFNTEFELDSWGSDENDNITGEQSEPSLWNSWNSLHSHLFPPDLVKLPPVSPHKPSPCGPRMPSSSPSSSPPTPAKSRKASLADDITIIGGNQTGIFVSHVRAGSPAEQCGLQEGSELLELEQVLFGGGSVLFPQCTGEVAHFSLQWWTEPSSLKHQSNPEAYSKLCSQLSSPNFTGADSFYVRVNFNIEAHIDPPSLGVSCDDIVHVSDTLYNKKYNWRCSLVDPRTAKPLQAGTLPSYNRAQQLLLVRLRKLSVEQKDFKKKFFKKASDRIRLVKAADPRMVGSAQQVLYTLSHRYEEHLLPYSLVQPVHVQMKRPVIFSPSLLSRGLIERLLQPAESGLIFNTCPPECIQATERQDKRVFLLDCSNQEQDLGIRLKSIQDVISQDKHCLLELGLPSVEGLLRQGIYPIVIHIRPKNKKCKKLRNLFPRCGEDIVMEEACQAEELQLETLPLLYYTLEANTWSCTNELLAAIRDTIHCQQRAVAWVELDRLQ
ncbi:caspase recruitment domain-containing protein 10 [Thalassophryne amazonica]|uniref:caspase recruitment domain-containing protein 10 n=1 Tax=Thalassophryne amazonica TaxID=390379 RepID=UPI001470918D|nr:caspase recruitment domain-containing protein 10 [Thalassophryne amazonica]